MTPELLNNNATVFSQSSDCPLVNGNVTLFTNTWEQHIKTKHPEVANAMIRTSKLHVFVESPKNNPVITTAMYLKKRHADIVWKHNRENIQASYDQDADVLYVSKEDPVPALTEESEDGLLLRYALSNDEPCGVTVVSFHQLWSHHKRDLAKRISDFLKTQPTETERAIVSL